MWRKAPIFQAQARGQRGGGGKTADYLKCPHRAFLLDLTLSLLVYKAARRNQLCLQKSMQAQTEIQRVIHEI